MGRQNGSANWMKVQKHTPDKPEIRHIARRCGCGLGDAFLAWFKVYTYFDETTADGSIAFFAPEDVDDIGGLPGLGKAMTDVGWLIFDSSGCTIVNWDRHNGTSAKRRAVEAERQARLRDEARTRCVPPSPCNDRDSHTQTVRALSRGDRDGMRTDFVTEQSRAEQRFSHG